MAGAESANVRVALLPRASGRCAGCGLPIGPGRCWDLDHVIPLAIGGLDDMTNLHVLCGSCHAGKTAGEDVPRIAKARRVEARPPFALTSTRRTPIKGTHATPRATLSAVRAVDSSPKSTSGKMASAWRTASFSPRW